MPSVTLRPLVYAYISERRGTGDLAPATAPNVRYALLRFCDVVGEMAPGRLRAEHIERYLAAAHLSKATKRNQLSQIRGFCHWLVRRGHLKLDPTLDIKAPRQPKPVPRSIPADSIRHLIRTLPDSRARLIVVWAIQLGLRAVELSRLEVGDIDLEQRSVLIHGKGGWERLLPITEEAWSVYVAYIVEYPARAGPLLRSFTEPWKGISPCWVARLVSRWMKDAELLATGHALRHSTATHLLRGKGADIRDVQDVLGHQALASTSIYLPHSDLPRLREVMEGRTYMDPPAEAG